MRQKHSRRKGRWWATCLATLLLVGCPISPRSQSAPPAPSEIKQAPATPIALKKAELGDDETWDPAWDQVIETALPDDLLWSRKVAKDVKAFCPRFSTMSVSDRRAYWAYFFQALAGAETGLRSTADVRHTEPEVAVKDSVTHRMVRAEGLLQLTYEDAERYGCDFDWDQDKNLRARDPEKTILQPDNNLLCGVRILHSQLIDKQKPLLTRTSYWSTLRPGWPGYGEFLKQMANVPEECGRRSAHTRPVNQVGSRSSSRVYGSAFASSPAH
jgi:hypothetical protein